MNVTKLIPLLAISGMLFFTGCVNPFGEEQEITEDLVEETIDNLESTLGNASPLQDNGDHYLLGGDIILNKLDREHQSIIAAINQNPDNLSKTTAMQYVCIPSWPKGVVTYTLSGFSAAEKTIIQNAMNSISSVAKVTFTLTASNKSYVYKISKIKSTSVGGVSTIGYTTTPYCQLAVVNAQTCVHEFMHGLGYGHEHQRNDRDKYVTIKTSNILSGYANQFEKVALQTAYKTTTYSNGKVTTSTSYVPYSKLVTGYDYASIMHYPKNAFAKSATLITIDAKGKSIGVSTVLSANDKTGLIAVYGKK